MLEFKNISNLLLSGIIILFGLYPIIPEYYESYVPIMFVVVSLIIFIANKRGEIKYRTFIIMSSVFAIFVLSATLSENKSLGFRKIETMASLIGLPIAFFILLNNYKINFRRFQRFFAYSFFASNILFSLIALYLIRYYRNPKFATKDSEFFRSAITDLPYIGEHSIYVSLFLGVAVLSGIYLLNDGKNNKTTKVLISVGILILVVLLFLLMSKGVLLGLVLAIIVLFIVRNKHWKKIVITAFLIVAFIAVLLPTKNNRFLQLINKQSFEKVDLKNSTSVRFYILKSALNLAIDQPFLGYGLGDVQAKLDEEYRTNNLPLPLGKYNSHNQYLFVWLSCGFFGLILFLFYLGYITKIALKNNDYFLLSITTLYMVVFLFENVLSRQSGVILFAFLVNFLVFKNLSLDKNQNDTLPSIH